MAIGNLYELTFYIDVNGNATQNKMGYVQTAGSNDSDTLEALAAAWYLNNIVDLLAILSSSAELTRVRADQVTGVDEIPGFVDKRANIGLYASDALPANMCGLFHFDTNAPNAKHNGRLFISGMPEGGQAEGIWDASFLVTMQAFADELEDDLVTLAPQDAEFSPVVISRFLDGIKRVPPLGFLVGEVTPEANIRQQRNRKTKCFGLS